MQAVRLKSCVSPCPHLYRAVLALNNALISETEHISKPCSDKNQDKSWNDSEGESTSARRRSDYNFRNGVCRKTGEYDWNRVGGTDFSSGYQRSCRNCHRMGIRKPGQ